MRRRLATWCGALATVTTTTRSEVYIEREPIQSLMLRVLFFLMLRSVLQMLAAGERCEAYIEGTHVSASSCFGLRYDVDAQGRCSNILVLGFSPA